MGSEIGKEGVTEPHEGVGDPFTYRKRSGRLTASEWVFQILLPASVVSLGACSARCAGCVHHVRMRYAHHLSDLLMGGM